MKLVSFLLFALLTSSAAAVKSPKSRLLTSSPRRSFVTPHTTSFTGAHTHTALSIRGGAGPIDPVSLAKWTTIFSLADSIYQFLLPEKHLENYGMPTTPLMQLIAERQAATILSFNMIAYCLLFQETSLKTAIGVATLPLMLDYARSELRGDPAIIGFQKGILILPTAVAGALAYGCFNDADWADTAMKAYIVWVGVNGAGLVTLPETFTKLWKCTFTTTAEEKHAMKYWGAFMAALAVYIGSIKWGDDPMKSLGYGWLTLTLFMAYDKFFGKMDEVLTNSTPMLLWILLGTVVSVTLALD